MRISGTFNGTGAAVYLCIGFVPDYVTVWNLEGTQVIKLEWTKEMMRSGEIVEGIQFTGADVAAAALTKGAGILPYYGGEVLSATAAGTTTYGEGVYLKKDDWDYRYYSGNKSPGDAVAVDIDTWTLGSSTNYTGNFNEDVNGTYIGEGSRICIDGKWYSIVALTATQGEAANEVTLSHAVSSGKIYHISGMYDYKPMVAGENTPAGFVLANATVNVNNAICAFEAGAYDR